MTVAQNVRADLHQRWLGARRRQDKENSHVGQAAREQSKILGAGTPRSALEEVPETWKGAWVLVLRSRDPSPNRLESQGIDPGRVRSLGVYGTRAWTSFDFCRNLLHQIMWKQNPSGFGGRGELFVFKMCLMYVLLYGCFLSPKCFHRALESRDLCIWISEHHTFLWRVHSLGDLDFQFYCKGGKTFPCYLRFKPWEPAN